MEYKFIYNNQSHTINIEKEGDSLKVKIDDGKFFVIDLFRNFANAISINIDGALKTIYVAKNKDKVYVAVNGEYFVLELEKPGTKSRIATAVEKGNSVASQMPGLLVKLPVKIGDNVKAGDVLAIVEAMKMQNELCAPSRGVVKKINYKEGDQVDAFVPIVELEI